jgi:RHS repeat-associated protein
VDGWNPALAGTTGNTRFNVWADLDGNNSNALLTRYFHGDQPDQLSARQDALTAYWYLTDRQGSVREVLDSSANVKDGISYDGWGNIVSETNSAYRGQYTWTGRQFDIETNLQYNRARWYDPASGRWITQDPVGFDAGDSNLYRYAANRPDRFIDPAGTTVDIIAFEGAAGFSKEGVQGFLGLSDSLLRLLFVDPIEKKYGNQVKVIYQQPRFGQNMTGLVNQVLPLALTPRLVTGGLFTPCMALYDRIVLVGYSWGGDVAINLARTLNRISLRQPGFQLPQLLKGPNPISIQVDLLSSIDPVALIPGTGVGQALFSWLLGANLARKSLANVAVWQNYFQDSDTHTLRPFVLHGQQLPADNNNQLVTAKELNGVQQVYSAQGTLEQNKLTALSGHILIPYVQRIRNDWDKLIAGLVAKPLVSRPY